MKPTVEVKGAVTKLRFLIDGPFSQWLWLTSDNHFDAVDCNRRLLKKHLDEAKTRDALIFVFGDWFDAMQGRFDKRSSKDDLRPEYNHENYYNLIVADSAKFLAPYSDNLVLMADGNHETAVLKYTNNHILTALLDKIHVTNPSAPTIIGGYGGWVKFMFDFGAGKGPRVSKNLKYYHGAGGNAPVTKGIIQTNRQAAFLPDADIVANGHNHQAYDIPLVRERISTQGVQYFDLVWYIRTSGYKQDFGDGSRGWAVEKGFGPAPIGGCWVHLVREENRINITCMQEVEAPEV